VDIQSSVKLKSGRRVRSAYDAVVILPNHLHAVWTLPDADVDFSTRWKKIKSLFSRHCKTIGTSRPSLARKGEKGIWQRRFWEHCIRSNADYHFHVEYCHLNPVKHGLVSNPQDWPFSSRHRNAMRENN
jgi:putative transposase